MVKVSGEVATLCKISRLVCDAVGINVGSGAYRAGHPNGQSRPWGRGSGKRSRTGRSVKMIEFRSRWWMSSVPGGMGGSHRPWR